MPVEFPSDVDALAENIVLVDDNVTEIDADTELNAAILGNDGILYLHCPLYLDSTQYGVHDARELHQHGIARDFDDASVTFGNRGIYDFFPVGFKLRNGARLVSLHEAAVTDHVGGEDGRKSALDPKLFHRSVPRAGSCAGDLNAGGDAPPCHTNGCRCCDRPVTPRNSDLCALGELSASGQHQTNGGIAWEVRSLR